MPPTIGQPRRHHQNLPEHPRRALPDHVQTAWPLTHVTASLWQSLLTRRPGTRLVRFVTIFSAVPGTGNAPACGHASRGYYGLYLPPGRTTIAHVCSMFARMSRYGPVAADTTRHPHSWSAVQSGRSRHASAQNDTRWRSKIEQSSGLLIRGFGVRVPGGAPGGIHTSPASMFTFGSDTLRPARQPG